MDEIDLGSNPNGLLELFNLEHEAETHQYNGDFEKASEVAQNIIDNHCTDKSEKGWYCAYGQNGNYYGGGVLQLQTTASSLGFMIAAYNLTIPNRNCFFRAELGFEEHQGLVKGSVAVSILFTPTGKRGITLTPKIELKRRPARGEVGLLDNPMTSMAVEMPDKIKGLSGKFRIRIDCSNGSGKPFHVLIAMARITHN